MVAQVAKELGILTVAVADHVHFEMEGNKRSRVADQGMLELSAVCRFLDHHSEPEAAVGPERQHRILLDAAKAANTVVLQGAVQGIAELITRPGLINVDFADVRTSNT